MSKTIRETVKDLILKHPDMTMKDIAQKANTSTSYVSQIRTAMRKEAGILPPVEVSQSAKDLFNATFRQKNSVEDVLTQRGALYGQYVDVAATAQALKDVMRSSAGERWAWLKPCQKESLEMIANKIARIVNGDPDYVDSWTDIAGYSQLVADHLEGFNR